MKPNKKDSIATWSAIAMLIWGVMLTTCAFFVPPMGEVHDSVLWVLGQILIYCGSIFGIAMYARKKLDDIEERINKK